MDKRWTNDGQMVDMPPQGYSLASLAAALKDALGEAIAARLDGSYTFGDPYCLSLSEGLRTLTRLRNQLYLQHHRRLPGSVRTKRLMKKRRAMVRRWCAVHYGC